jgi:predicted KAP-like P-loop ATPase
MTFLVTVPGLLQELRKISASSKSAISTESSNRSPEEHTILVFRFTVAEVEQ